MTVTISYDEKSDVLYARNGECWNSVERDGVVLSFDRAATRITGVTMMFASSRRATWSEREDRGSIPVDIFAAIAAWMERRRTASNPTASAECQRPILPEPSR